MRLLAVLPLILAVIAVPLVANVAAPPPPPPPNPAYTLMVSPSVPVSLGTPITLALSVSNGGSGRTYTTSIDVRKPNATGEALTTQVLTTNSGGTGSISISYPSPSFTALNGTVATDVGGVYNVIANQTGPTNTGIVATAQFTVSSQLTVVLSQPTPGIIAQRGNTVTISVTVSSLNGPDSGATVFANTPSNGKVFLLQVGAGVFSINYQVLTSDPLGSWTIIVQASDSQGNSGSSSPVTITVTKNDLIVDSLVTYNDKDAPTTSFSPGDTIHAFFRIRYSSGTYLITGQYPVVLRNPSGGVVANLTASYDGSRFGFFTATGYPVPAFDSSGSWSVVISPNSINDGFGNTGPGLATSVPLQVVTSPLSYWPFVLSAAIAILGAVVTAKRFDTSLEGFGHLEALMGGPVPRSSSLVLLGEPGSGKTILCYELLHEELESGRLCALLSYDAFPEDVQARMGEFGWDIISHLRKGRLKIIDCYSGLAGQGEGALRDPSDLTELNIQVTSFISKAKNVPVTLILDSLTPIFNGVDGKQAINFLQTVGAKVKKTGGLFILTASRGAVPEDSIAKIKSIVDGVIELSIIRSGRKAHRFLSVLKMERRRIATERVAFEIERGRGLVFRVSRFGILRRKIVELKIRTPILSPRKEASSVAAPPRAEGKRADERSKDGKNTESSPKPAGPKQH